MHFFSAWNEMFFGRGGSSIRRHQFVMMELRGWRNGYQHVVVAEVRNRDAGMLETANEP